MIEESKSGSDDSELEIQNPFETVDTNGNLYAEDENSITVGEVLLIMFDWVAAHKTTNRCTADVWNVLRAVVPPGTNPGTFAMAERILKAHLGDALVRIAVCRFDCIAYFNFKSEPFAHMQYADLQECPMCGAARSVELRGKLVDAKVMYWFPSQRYWEYLFSDRDLVPHLYNDTSCSVDPVGSLRASQGYFAKVLQNPNISADPRNQAVVLSTDGMPFFKDIKCRSGWPVLMRSAMLPDGLWNAQPYTHMLAFQASDYLDEDSTSKTGVVRVKRCVLVVDY